MRTEGGDVQTASDGGCKSDDSCRRLEYQPPRLVLIGAVQDLIAGGSGTQADGSTGQFKPGPAP